MRTKFLTVSTICFLIFGTGILTAQHYYRIKADFSFKYAGSEETGSSLVMGTAYYDKIDKKITYQVRFPKAEYWAMQDTNMYKFANGQLIEKSFMVSPVETSIFNLALQSTMNNFALENSAYSLKSVEEDKGMVIATWSPPKVKGNDKIGDVLIANKNGLLSGIIFKNAAGDVVAKQFYDDYEMVSGINFPKEVTQIVIANGKESYQITNYKNIVIDESGKDHLYRYPVH
jgi:hypothetical protein